MLIVYTCLYHQYIYIYIYSVCVYIYGNIWLIKDDFGCDTCLFSPRLGTCKKSVASPFNKYEWKSPTMGVPLYRWMVYFMENPQKKDDNWGYPLVN